MSSTHARIRRIGILTGGGDCPGLNAVIRAVAKTAIYQHGIEVVGIRDGFVGLVEDDTVRLEVSDVSGILTRGGTILGTNNKCNPRHYCVGANDRGEPVFADVTDRVFATIERHGLDAIIVIGGDGTMSAASTLLSGEVNLIGVPKTIDNDIMGTEITFGFLTATATATEALDRLQTTADSHHRVMVCEVMGRNAGWIGLTAGIASGADVILLPELPFDLDVVRDFIGHRMDHGPGFAVVVVSEGARPAGGEQVVARIDPTSPDPIRLGGIGQLVAKAIGDRLDVETRTTVLGHVQRGGSPTAADRILATNFGFQAIQTLMEGKTNRMVVRQNHVYTDVDLSVAANRQRLVPLDHPLIEAGRAVRTCFGVDAVPASSTGRPSVVV